MNPKQIIVVRKDLNMRKGKIAAQAAHASLGAIINLAEYKEDSNILQINLNMPYVKEWLFDGSFTKICVSVNSEAELIEVHEKAKQAGIITCLITDSGRTEFKGVATKTCCAVGPCDPSMLEGITSHLSLL